MSQCAYCKYLGVGAAVGIMAIIARELISHLLPADSPGYYLLSVIIIYTGGIIASFYGHFRISFSHVCNKSATIISMGKFIMVALAGMGVTSLLSYQIRYNLDLEPVFGGLLPSIAFGVAAVTASLLTYKLNARYIFVDTSQYDSQVNSKCINTRKTT